MARSQLRIKNETRYSTRDLRRFFTAGLRALGASEEKWIKVRYSRGSVAGLAEIGRDDRQGYRIWMLPDRPVAIVTGSDGRVVRTPIAQMGASRLAAFASTFEHEIAHTLGISHREMSHAPAGGEWWVGLTIRVMPEPIKIPAVERREARARTHVEKLEQQLARTQRLLKKWRARVRYYNKRSERKAAAAPKEK